VTDLERTDVVDMRRRMEEMARTEPHRSALARTAMLATVAARKFRFRSTRDYELCREYVVSHAVPRFQRSSRPFSVRLASRYAKAIIAGFLTASENREGE
jgi:hypothetical protein